MKYLLKSPVFVFVSTLLFFSCFFTAVYAEDEGLTMEKIETWLKGYEQAWEQLDADKAAMLFTENATYQEDPYKEPFKGRTEIHNYWSTVTQDQSDVDFTYEVISVTGNKGVAHWHSEFVQPSTGATVILDGIFVLEFAKGGLCQSLREWWHFKSS